MTWKKFCEMNDVPEKYKTACVNNLIIPDDPIQGSFIKMAKNMVYRPCSALFLGKAGRGKTHFLYAVIRALIEFWQIPLSSVRFFRASDLDALLLEQCREYGSSRVFVKSLDDDYLFIDDFGVGRKTETSERDYYDLIDRREAHEKFTIISSNIPELNIKEIFGERINSRLKSYCKIEFNGPDLRENY